MALQQATKRQSKRPSERDKADLRALLDRWAAALDLTKYELEIIYKDEAPSDHRDGAGLGDDAHAEAQSHYPYRTADILIFPAFWSMPARIRERTIVHELLHIVTQPLLDLIERQAEGRVVTPDEARNITEVVTEHLAAAFFEATGQT